MRRQLIQFLLPLVFASLPPLGAGLVYAALPPVARDFYGKHLTPLDMVIIGLGGTLFLIQSLLAYRALRWQGTTFDERPDPWLNRLTQTSEWFPLLGLIGTVGAILQTFSEIAGKTPQQIIENYAPALTATGSGLFMALINILPAWIVMVGRPLILSLGGDEPEATR